MTFRTAKLLLIAAVLATGGSLAAAQSATAAAPTNVRNAMEQFNRNREAALAAQQALINDLKSATEEKRKEILEKLQSQQKTMLEAQRALGKQIRDEMRNQRTQTRPGG